MAETTPPRVLIVDPSEDARDVLRTALGRRGISCLTEATPAAGLESAKARNPEVIVLDLDSLLSTEPGQDDFVFTAKAQQSSLLVIGQPPRGAVDLPSNNQIAKPYHFAPLVNKIVQLMAYQHS